MSPVKTYRICEERGSVLVLHIGIMAGVIAFSLVLFDIYAVYVARRVAQSAADAAAMGALEVLRREAHEEVVAEADKRLAARMQEIHKEVSSRVDAWEKSRRSELTEKLRKEREDSCPPPPETPAPGSPPTETCPDYSGIPEEVDRIIEGERPEVKSRYFRTVVRQKIREVDLEEAIIRGTTPELTWLIAEFLTPTDLACLVRAAGALSRSDWEATASHFASVNGGQVPEFQFPYDGRAAISVTVPARLRLLAFDRLLPERLRNVNAEAAVQINSFGPFPVNVGASC